MSQGQTQTRGCPFLPSAERKPAIFVPFANDNGQKSYRSPWRSLTQIYNLKQLRERSMQKQHGTGESEKTLSLTYS